MNAAGRKLKMTEDMQREFNRRARESNKEYRKNNPDKIRAKKKKYKLEHADRIKEQGRAYYERNHENILLRSKEWRLQASEEQQELNKLNQKEWRSRNIDKCRKDSREYSKAYYRKKHPKVEKEKLAGTHYSRNKEKYIEYARLHKQQRKEYIQKNREAIRDKCRKYEQAWIKANPEKHKAKVNACSTLRRARKLGAEGKYTPKEWFDLKARCDNKCLCCKRQEPEIKLSVDHIMPLSLGGSNYIDNIQPLCMHCNLIKNNKHIDYRNGVSDMT